VGARARGEDKPEDPGSHSSDDNQHYNGCRDDSGWGAWANYELEQGKRYDGKHEVVEDNANDVASSKGKVLPSQVTVLCVGQPTVEPSYEEAKLGEHNDAGNEDEQEDGHTRPYITLFGHTDILSEASQAVGSVGEVDTVNKTLRSVTLANKALVPQKE
jgi:hypothetical protein